MNLSQLQKITETPKKRLGQGHGSGRVKTSGRGTKGQKARRTIPLTRYSGGSLAFIKRLPFLRGKTKNYSLKPEAFPVAVEKLNVLKAGTVVDTKALVSAKIVQERDIKKRPVKLLGSAKLAVALTVKVPASKSAALAIEKAGGTVEA